MTDERAALTELALDLRWAWDHGMDELWSELDAELWNRTHNPWVVLQSVASARLAEVLARPAERRRVAKMLERRHRYLESPDWFQHAFARSPLSRVAYFSMEFMLSEALPIYSGGLGNVAGDQLKAASDLGVPVIGVGLLYQQGYFRQVIDADGAQSALYPYNDPDQLPITAGARRRRRVAAPRASRCRAPRSGCAPGRCRSGACMLYLLDSNDSANPPRDRGITSELYGGGPELRLQQEMVLGIGGWRLLRALGLAPRGVPSQRGPRRVRRARARARRSWRSSGQPFDVALAATRPGNLFTTHTPVAAGFDRFAPAWWGSISALCRADSASASSDLLALGRRESGRRRRAVQHGLPGDPRQRRGQRRQPPARRGQPAHVCSRCFRAGRRPRCRSATSPTACTFRPGTRPRPTSCGRRPAAGRWLRHARTASRRPAPASRRRALGAAQRAGARRWSSTRASAWRGSCAPARRAAGDVAAALRSVLDPDVLTLGLRAPLRDLQAAQPAAARPGAAGRGC